MKKIKSLKGLYIFITGVILSAIGGEFLENTAIKNEYTIIAFGIIAMLSAVYFFFEVYKKVSDIASWSSVKLKYIDEEFRVDEGIAFKGTIHNELKKLVSTAEFEILAIASASTNGIKSPTLETQNRKDYLTQIEKQIEKKRSKGFRYIRIEHFPSSISLEELNEIEILKVYFGEVNIEHTLNLEKLNQKYHDCELDVSIMKATTQKNVNVMIIDRRYIALEGASAYSKSGKPYNEGLFVFDDKEGEIVKTYLKYFDRLIKYAVPLKINKPAANKV